MWFINNTYIKTVIFTINNNTLTINDFDLSIKQLEDNVFTTLLLLNTESIYIDEKAVYELIDREVDKINQHLPDWKSIKHIVIKKSEFNKTTGMKIRRFVEENKLAD